MSEIHAELQSRAMNILTLAGGRATLEQIRAQKLIPGPLVTEIMRQLVSGKRVGMEGEATYVLLPPTVAESRQLAGTQAQGTDPGAHRPQTPVKSVVGPAEPGPRRRGRRVQGDTEADSRSPKPIACLRCHMQFPPIEFAGEPGRRRFRLCGVCRTAPKSAKAPTITYTDPPAEPAGQTTLASIAAKITGEISIDIAGLRPYLDELLRTGLYGSTLEQAIERLLCDAIRREIASGILTLGDRA